MGTMADYYPLIARAVAGLPQNTDETRRALYDRARNALVAQLRGRTSMLNEAEIIRERRALDDAIRKVETQVNDKQHTAASVFTERPGKTALVSRISLYEHRRALLIAIGLLATVLVIAIGILVTAPDTRSSAVSPPAKPLPPPQPGQYQGSSDGNSISVTLVKVDQGVLVQSVGHNFSGSGIDVGAVSAKDGKPFGAYDGGILTFPIVFLVKFNPVNNILTDSGGSIQASAYSGTLWLRDQKVHLILVEGNANGFAPSFSDIGFSTPAAGFKMKEHYDFDLSRK
jgi:hypothetical protein